MTFVNRAASAALLAGLSVLATIPAWAQSTEKSEVSKVRFGVVKVSVHTPFFTAQKLGYFKDEGIEAESVFVRSGAEGQSGLISDSINFVGVNSVTFLLGLSQNFPFAAISDCGRGPEKPPGWMAILTRSDGSVNSPKDLEGKTFGTVSRRTIVDLLMVPWARKNNVDLTKLRVLEIPHSLAQDALISKQVDAIAPIEPFITRALQDSRIKQMYDFVESEPGYAGCLWVGSEKWVNSHPIATKKVQRALNRANEYLSKNRDERLKLTAEWTGLATDILSKATPEALHTSLPEESLRWQAKAMKDAGWVDKDIDVNKGLWKAP